jgi:hypothetical protein
MKSRFVSMSITRRYLVIVCLLLLTACAPVYSPYVYDQTASLKTEALALMRKAEEPYAKHAVKAERLMNDLLSLEQQEVLRKRNNAKVKQWQLLINDRGHLLGGFIHRWQTDTTLTETFISLESRLVGEAFDLIQSTEKQRQP